MVHVAKQAKKLGLTALENALSTTFMLNGNNPYWHYLSVLQAAHATELIIKAKIAEENEELIYEKDKLGRSTKRTIKYSDLPVVLKMLNDRQYELPSRNKFDKFGKLRNEIQHLAVPDENHNLHKEAADFIFSVIDPLMHNFWGDSVLNYLSEEIDYLDKFVFSDLNRLGIECCNIPDELQEVAQLAKSQALEYESAMELCREYGDEVSEIAAHREEILERMQKHLCVTAEKSQSLLSACYKDFKTGMDNSLWWIW